MAVSSCIKCGPTIFQMVTMEPGGSSVKVLAVQCAKCGGVVGVVDYLNTASMIDGQNRVLKAQSDAIGSVGSQVNALTRAVAQLAAKK